MTRLAPLFRLSLPVLLALMLSATLASAAPTPDCEALAAAAGAAEGLPEGLLPAIARVEAGRKTDQGDVRAWPWTLNEGGNGHFFDTKQEAVDYLQAALDRGVTNIDIGCMQINHRWHAAAFPSAEVMMDPVANTAYAARFMKELYKQLGSWDLATSAYHSPDPTLGAPYQDKVASVMGSDGGGDGGALPAPVAAAAAAAISGTLSGLLAVPREPLVAMGDMAGVAALMPGTLTPIAGGAAAPAADPAADPATAAALPQPPAGQPGPVLLALDWHAPADGPPLDRATLSPALQDHWDEVAALRAKLAEKP